MTHERIRRRRLPHWDIPGATYFVTACLAGSIPARGLLDIKEYRRTLSAQCPKNLAPRDWAARSLKLSFARTDGWLDREPSVHHLSNEQLAQTVAESMLYFVDVRYKVYSFVVMPSHIHWVFRPESAWCETLPPARSPREAIVHTFKTHTALLCNRMLGTSGTFWQDETYDHIVRSEAELARIIDYVELNPVKAGLCGAREAWKFSSASMGVSQLRTE